MRLTPLAPALTAFLFLVACAEEQTTPLPPDTAELMADLNYLTSDALEGRFVDSDGSRLAQEYIIERFEALGLTPAQGEDYRVPFPVERNDQALTGNNLLAAFPGTESMEGPALVVTAHYDAFGIRDGEIYPGADDNASGVAAMLAMAEHFNTFPPDHQIIFAALDAEEGGLDGAIAFLAAPPIPVERIGANLNLDMVARADKGELYAVGTYHFPGLIPIIDEVAAGSPLTLLRGHDRPEDGDQDWSFASDHAPFLRGGIPIIYLGVEDHPDYHQPTDTADRIDPEIFTRSTHTAIMVAEAMDENLDEIAGMERVTTDE